MPFIGLDWRSPGDSWIRTEFGWKRIAEICNTPYAQIAQQIKRSLSPRSLTPRSISRKGSSGDVADSDGDGKLVQAAIRSLEEREKHLADVNHMLSQRCVSACTSSRESNHYSTIGDAVNKLNFLWALQDENCFPFICQVVTLLFEQHYLSLSGSMQTALMKMTEVAKDIAMKTKKHTSLVVKLIESAIATLEKGRRRQFTGFAIRNTDTKIKSLFRMKRQLTELLHKPYGGYEDISELPDDCLRHIISYLSHPKDVLNLGQTSFKLYALTEENWVWRNLTHYHYGSKLQLVVEANTRNASSSTLRDGVEMEEEEEEKASSSSSTLEGSSSTMEEGRTLANNWKVIFKQEFILSRRKLRTAASHAACLCTGCKFVYWESYGHPCCTLSEAKDASSQEPSSENLTPEQFIKFFAC